LDSLRRRQGRILDGWGLEPHECEHQVVATGAIWRLRNYGGAATGPPVLIVAAPIKRPYIWDLLPPVSAVRCCLEQGLRVFLLEWAAPRMESGGLTDYAGRFLGAAVAAVAQTTNGAKPILMGHSLGGTLAAIYAALAPHQVRGLVLLGAPLCFAPGSSRLRDALVALAPSSASIGDLVPGSWLTHLSALACPETFLWSRFADASLSLGDPWAFAVHARVERWALDEQPLPGQLMCELLDGLFRDDRLAKGRLLIEGTAIGPTRLDLPTLMVVNRDDELAPPAAVGPFAAAMPAGRALVLEHASELGAALPHLAILVGRRAHAQIWPMIIHAAGEAGTRV
jgi:polyhydroxyalkanoate synthase